MTISAKGQQKELTYRDSGVDIDRANRAKLRIKQLARATFTPGVVSEIGAFAGLFRPDFSGLTDPLLVASADGVGTKLKIAFLTGIHNTVGRDIVSHCANDILVQGALPAFFLDYIATGRLQEGVIEQLVEGLSVECRVAGCALLGGETAEMPDFYDAGEYDLAGFIVGFGDAACLPGSDQVRKGDQLLGLSSSGLHTNGYSLVRKLCFERMQMTVEGYVDDFGRTLGKELLEPHRNYVPVLRDLIRRKKVHALAHITGGGIQGNLNRILPPGKDAVVDTTKWKPLPVFDFIQRQGNVARDEMFRTFNMGIGIILVVGVDEVDEVTGHLKERAQEHFWIGRVEEGSGKVHLI